MSSSPDFDILRPQGLVYVRKSYSFFAFGNETLRQTNAAIRDLFNRTRAFPAKGRSDSSASRLGNLKGGA